MVQSGSPYWPATSAVTSAGIGGSRDSTLTLWSATDQMTLDAASATYVVPPIFAVA